MELVYWGTAAAEGIPAVFCSCALCEKARTLKGKNIRTRSQMLIDGRLLVDLGPDTYAHALQYDTNLMELGHILITHSHSDHFYGEDLVFRAEPYGHGGLDAPVTLYANEKVGKLLKRTKEVYNDTNCFDRCVHLQPVRPFQTFEADGYLVTPLPAAHDPQEDCFIFDILSTRDGKRLLYGNDSSFFPAATMEYLRGKCFDLLSLDCTMGRDISCTTHMTLPLCRELTARLREQGTADQSTTIVVTHFSHNAGLLHEELCELAQAEGFLVAYDGMTLRL